jgi:hypothetical protein
MSEPEIDLPPLADQVGKLRLRGLDALDQRTEVARAVREWEREVCDDLGGRENLSTAKLALVRQAALTKLILDSGWAWLLTQEAIFGRSEDVLAWCQYLGRLGDRFAALLVKLGLERRQREAPRMSLEDYITQKRAAALREGDDQ